MRGTQKFYLKVLWLSKTYPFLWAHKPLCGTYREDVLRIRGVHLCRSCVFSYLGIVCGALLPLLFPASWGKYGTLILPVTTLIVLPFSYPVLYKRLPRPCRDLVRLMLGIVPPLVIWTALGNQIVLALCVLLLSCIFWKIYFRQRQRRKLASCESCNEYSADTICSGYVMQAGRIREYEEEATEYLLATGHMPDCLK